MQRTHGARVNLESSAGCVVPGARSSPPPGAVAEINDSDPARGPAPHICAKALRFQLAPLAKGSPAFRGGAAQASTGCLSVHQLSGPGRTDDAALNKQVID